MLIASVSFDPTSFGWLGALAVVAASAAAAWAYTRGPRWREHSPRTHVLLLGCRLGAVACLALALLHPSWVSERVSEHRPVIAAVLDDSASMGRPAEGDANGPTRYARATEALTKALAPALKGRQELHLFDVEGRSLESDKLPKAPLGEHSPLAATLLRIQHELGDASAGTLAGIVLLSDGAQTPGATGDNDLSQLHIPVYAVQVAAETAQTGPPDLAIQAVSANRQALVGNTVQAVVDITAAGAVPATAVPITILDGDRAVATRTIQWRPGDSAARAELEFIPAKPGEFTYTVQLGAVLGETALDNNRDTFTLSVRAKPLTVLYVDGVLRWEGKFLREALTADPDINFISSIRTARGSDRGSVGLLLGEQLANVNLVILGDVEAAYFSAEELRALRTWITEKKGALLVTGGYHSFGPTGLGRSELRDVLPVEFSAAADPQIEQPFGLKLTDAGCECPIFNLSGDRTRDAAFYHALPQLAGCSRIAGVKPGAQVFAVNPTVTAPDGTQGLPVMVVQQSGTGRAMVFAVDTTWKWRMVVGGYTGDTSFYQRFWGQLVRWMVGSEDQDAQQLYVSTDRQRYRVGDTIEVNIALRSPTGRSPGTQPATAPAANPGGAKQITAYCLDEKGGRMNVPLAELGGGRYRATLGAARPGRMDLTVVADVAAAPQSQPAGAPETRRQSQVVTVQVERPDIEMLDPRPDPKWLAQVTQLTGGRMLRPDQIAEWAKTLPAKAIEARSVQISDLWNNPFLAALFFILLCTEWLARRWNRLA